MTASLVSRYYKNRFDLTEDELSQARALELARVKKYMIDNPLRSMYSDSKAKAKRRGIEFNLSYEEFTSLANSTTHCPIFGCELVYALITNTGIKTKNPCRASLDRKDNTKGYSIDNCWMISWKANAMKNKHTTAELQQLVKGLQAAGIA
jgi:hypothetical protein